MVQPPAVVPQISPLDFSAELGKIPSMVEVGVNESEHAIIFGGPGTGKTTQAGLLSEFFNVLWLDGDKGLTALVNNIHPTMLERIKVVKIPDNTDYPIMCSTILQLVTGREKLLCIEHGTTNCLICGQNTKAVQVKLNLNKLDKSWIVVMDSQTQFYASVLAFAYYKDTGKAPGTGIPYDYRGNWDYRGIAYNMCDMFGNYLKDLKCQWVSVSHETMTEMEDGVTHKIVPTAGSKNLSSNYGKWFGSMVHARVNAGKINYISATTNSATVQTKSRSNVFLEKQSVPALLHLFRPKDAAELLKGSYTEWFLTEGVKDIKERTKGKEVPPNPKGILPI